MPTLICDLRPQAAAWAPEYTALREAGEPLILFWREPVEWHGMREVRTPAELESALEDEQIASLSASAGLPGWLPLGDCSRVLLLSETASPEHLGELESELIQKAFDAGCEAVELLPSSAARELAQSWHSGRRTAAVRLTRSVFKP